MIPAPSLALRWLHDPWTAVLLLCWCAWAIGPAPLAMAEDPARDGAPRVPVLEELERDLTTGRPEKRRAAVKKLAAIATRPAWDLVLKALQDPSSEVADEAQIVLARANDAHLIDDLYGRCGLHAADAWVRLRVAEAFGRMSSTIDGLALTRTLTSRDSELSRTILWTMERQIGEKRLSGDPQKLVKAVEGLCRSSADAELRCAALVTLDKLDHFSAVPLVQEAFAERDPALRCAALRVAREWTEAECLSLSEKLLADPETRVRAQAIDNLERLSTRASTLALVHQMAIEKRARLRWGILAFLQQRSGLKHGFDAAAWEAWAGTITGPWTTGEDGGVKSGPLGDTQIALAGLTLISDRVAFLIDLSGSTWNTKVGDRTRKEIIDEKLRAALLALPEGTEFNVIPYTNEPFPWEKSLVPNTSANVKRALDFFERCHQNGRGNFFDAALCALADPRVDTIVTLTDGIPTGGHRWNMELMVELLVERDRYRKVAFDSVLVDAPAGSRKKWAELAERTGGRSIAVELK